MCDLCCCSKKIHNNRKLKIMCWQCHLSTLEKIKERVRFNGTYPEKPTKNDPFDFLPQSYITY